MYGETHDLRIEGKLYRYCAICDCHYPGGTYYNGHLDSPQHRSALKARSAMRAWYRRNGS